MPCSRKRWPKPLSPVGARWDSKCPSHGSCCWRLAARRKCVNLRQSWPHWAFGSSRLREAGIAADAREDELEAFETFEANALAKARWFAALGNGREVIADDSGIEIDALRGQPGVRSKRWSGRSELNGQALDDANNAMLLDALVATGMPMPWTGRYVCAAAWVSPMGGAWVSRGEADGFVVPVPQGTSGFGYDPYFVSREYGRTFAEVSREEKAKVSHRGRAFRALVSLVGSERQPRVSG